MENNSKNSKKLGQFTLQYQETDWKFLKRLASRFQTGLVPDPIAAKPSLTVGLPEGISELCPKIHHRIIHFKNPHTGFGFKVKNSML